MRERERVYEKERVNHKCLISVVEPERKIKLNQFPKCKENHDSKEV